MGDSASLPVSAVGSAAFTRSSVRGPKVPSNTPRAAPPKGRFDPRGLGRPYPNRASSGWFRARSASQFAANTRMAREPALSIAVW